jgi:hypothetical protein
MRFLRWLGFPLNAEQWGHWAACQTGAFLGWLTTPALWLFAGPFRWAALIGGMMSAESAYQPRAVGDVGESLGILQFGKSMWTAASGYEFPSSDAASYEDDDPRFSSFTSGYIAAKYTAIALYETPRWFTFAIPVFGFSVMRYMWTCGVDTRCANRPAFSQGRNPNGFLLGKWDRMVEEGRRASGDPPRGITTFLAWRIILLPATIALLAWGLRTPVAKVLRLKKAS